ncbi:Glyoxylate/succinic semialdehyde reductase 2 chloroplastic [Zea mays]|nr:Glyoxylate/succinic semialdehyde reductase 2 chloroplastic [Zea mays]
MPAAAFFSAALPPPSRTLSRRLVVSRAAAAAASASASSSSGWQGGGGVEFQGKVGFLGLGIMGAPMASNLIKAGCDVTVWNRTKSKCDPLLSLGAKYEPTPAQVASSCDVTFAMLADPQSAAEVACGSSGAAEGLAPGKG